MAFKTKAMNLRSTARHVITEVRKLKDQMRARQLHNISIPQVSDVTNSAGSLVEGEFIAPASTATSTTPTDTGFTGAAMGGNGWSFSSVVYQFVAVAAGVLQAGFNAAGKFIAGAGAVTLDVDGISIVAGNSGQHKVKWKNGSDTIAEIDGYYYGSVGQLSISSIDAVAGQTIAQTVIIANGTLADPTIELYANNSTGVATVRQVVSSAETALSSTAYQINPLSSDVDTSIFGTSATAVAKVDAGLNRLETTEIYNTGTSTLSGAVTTGSTIISNRVIRFHSVKTGIADNTATGLFTITTTNETGSNDAGTYSVRFRANIQHGGASSHTAVKYFECYWVRAMREIGTGTNSAVTELVESASTATNAAEKDISTVTGTVVETSEYVNQFEITIDLTGTGVTTAVVSYDVELIWQFNTAPTIAAV